MEIFSFLNLTRARIVVVMLVALAGAVGGGVIMHTELASYATTVDVRVNEIFAPGRPAYDSTGYAPSLVATVTEGETAAQVSQRTGVAAGTVESGLDAKMPTDDGLPVELIYTGTTADESKRVAIAAADVSLIRTAELNRLRALVDRPKAARLTYDKASGVFNDFTVRTGFGDSLPDDIAKLEGTTIPAERADGNAAAVAVNQARLDKMKGALAEFSPLQNEKSSAAGQLSDVSQAVTNANDAAARSQDPGPFLSVGDTVADSGTSKLVRGAVGGLIVGVFLAVGLFVLADSRRTVRVSYPDDMPGVDPDRSRAVGAVVYDPDDAARDVAPPPPPPEPAAVSDEVLVRLAKSRPVAGAPRGRIASRRR